MCVTYWEIIADHLSKGGWSRAHSPLRILIVSAAMVESNRRGGSTKAVLGDQGSAFLRD
jgi:hypothetical protein